MLDQKGEQGGKPIFFLREKINYEAITNIGRFSIFWIYLPFIIYM